MQPSTAQPLVSVIIPTFDRAAWLGVGADREDRHRHRDEGVERVEVRPANAQHPGGNAHHQQRGKRRPPPPRQRHGDQHRQQGGLRLWLDASGHPGLDLRDDQHPGG